MFDVHEIHSIEYTEGAKFVRVDLKDGKVTTFEVSPADAGVPSATLDDLKGGDAAHNAAELAKVLTGADQGPHRDALVMGASLVLEVTGQASDLADGVAQASAAITDGKGAQFLNAFRQHFDG